MSHEPTHHENHDLHAAHAVPLWLLGLIFGVLMVLTLVTVGVTEFDLGYNGNLMLAMVIALVKAALVGLYFMHLRWDAPLNGFILVASLLFVTLFITFSLLDTGQYAPTQEAAAQRQVQTTPATPAAE